ncbi:DsbA family protein [Blastomonas sp.]|uniref:DsbA family protein n=1 Tax=Blastomonas sp. TaxID=1909299 RepID=UPI003593E531
MAIAGLLTLAAAVGTFMWQGGSLKTPPTKAGQTAEAAAQAAGINVQEKQAIEAIVRAYILENPEIIPEAVQMLQSRQAAKRIDAVRSTIETPLAGAFAGNPDGDIVLVEFSDFACGFCKQSVNDVQRLIGEDKNLKIVFQELPILSDESSLAAAWAMAAAQQGKYFAFYKAMFDAGRPSQSTIEQAARKAGLDIEAARKFATSSAAKTQIDANIRIAQQLEFSGTPSWVVGNRILNGAVGFDELKAAVDEARAKKAAG